MTEKEFEFENTKKISAYPDYKFYTIKKDDEVIGGFNMLVMDNLAHKGSPSAIFDGLVLTSLLSEQETEILMDFALKRSREAGCYKLVIASETTALINLDAIKFQQHGFCFVFNLDNPPVPLTAKSFFDNSNNGVTIVEATAAHIPAILSLYAQPDMDDGDILSTQNANRLYNKIEQYPNYKLYIAKFNEKTVGTFALLIKDNLNEGKLSCIVEDVVVSPDSQGRGIGKIMMNYAISQAKHLSCDKLTLSSNVKRSTAHSFYRALGFEQRGISFLVKAEQQLEETLHRIGYATSS